jgi:DNA polymerase III delta prime subunit
MSFENPMESFSWILKWRPQSLDDLILPKRILDPIKQYVRVEKKIPHFLFTSLLPGSGKSSTANIIIKELGADYIKINASSDNGIGVVRDTIEPYCTRNTLYDDQTKIVWLDEADSTSPKMQDGLRGVMEEYANNVQFILTGNNVSGISEPIKDRCEWHDFDFTNPVVRKEIIVKLFKRCMYILDQEGVKYDTDVLLKFVDKNYPRIRNIISGLQKYAMGNGMIIDEGIMRTTSIDESFFEFILAGNFTKAKEYVLKNNTQADVVYTDIYKNCLDKITNMNVYGQFLVTLNDYQYKHAFVIDKEMNLVSALMEICSIIKSGK